jgi:predicted nucleic acid-binding protein
MLFDSDVIIWLLRQNEAAATMIEEAEEVAISVVTYMEVMRGLRDRHAKRETQFMLDDYGFTKLALTESIGQRASHYVEESALQPGLEIADALIAATAAEHGLVLCTANLKHYRSIKGIELLAFRP